MHLRLLLNALLDSIRAGKRIPMTRMTTIYSSRWGFIADGLPLHARMNTRGAGNRIRLTWAMIPNTRLLYNSIVIGDPYGVQGVLEYTESLCGRYITLEERRRNANTAPMWVSFRRKASWYVMVVKTSFDVPQFAMDLYVEGQSFCNPGTIRGGHPIEMSCAAFEGNPASVTSIYAEVDRRGIYECYKQDDRASWACFKD